MIFPTNAYDPSLLKMMDRVFEDACRELGCVGINDSYCVAARAMMEIRLLTAVASGERDTERLKFLALHAVDGRAGLQQILLTRRRLALRKVGLALLPE